MRDFLKMFLAALCALFIMGILGFILFFGIIGSLASIGNEKPVLPNSGVLTIDFSQTAITEQTTEANAMSIVQGNTQSTIGIWEAVQSIKYAAADPSVQYIFIKPDNSLTGISNMEEIRKALSDFRKSGKAVIAYTENPTSGSYYMATVADKIYMNSNVGASPMINGVGSQLIFLKDILDKFGVNVQLIRHGKYKSAGEMFIKNAPSPENMEQNQAMINSLWNSLASAIAESRHISVEDFSAMIDNLELNNAQDMENHKLVDELVTKEELKEKLATLAGEEPGDLKYIPFADYVTVNSKENTKAKNKIAVIYAQGEIVPGNGKDQLAGDRFASIVAKVRADSSVKAVVLRVASPGGSVLAADKVKTELDLLKKDKPLIASYGFAAASGGYWISNNADKIFSNKTTITGSIGVFSIIPDFSKTAKNILNVNFVTVGSSKHSDMYSAMRPLREDEIDYLQHSVEDIYDAFVNSVATGRNLKPDYVDSIAQGRVWTGEEALKIKLVDEIGTLEDAINYAILSTGANSVDLSEWDIQGYPRVQSQWETLLEAFGMEDPTEEALAKTPFIGIYKAFKNWDYKSSDKMYARLPFEMIMQN